MTDKVGRRVTMVISCINSGKWTKFCSPLNI